MTRPSRARLDPADTACLEQFARDALPHLAAISREVTAAILTRQPDLVPATDDAAIAAVDRATTANVNAIVSTLAAGVRPDRLDVPDGALDLMDHVAVGDDALPAMLRAYRLGAAAFTQVWLHHLAAGVADVPQYGRLAAACTEHVAAYVDRISEVIVERWSTIARDAQRSGRRRDALVRAMLDGQDIDPRELGHPLDRGQLVLATAQPQPGTDGPDAVAVIARRLGDPPRIVLPMADGITLAWLASPLADLREHVARARDTVPPDTWSVIAGAAPGAAAFAATAHDVHQALRVLRRGRSSPHAVAFADIALTCALLDDEPRARRLVDAILGPLAGPDLRAARLRETLHAYFEASDRKTGAAALLRVHEKTVSHRLRQIEAELGHTIHERRSDLAIALRLNRALASKRARS